MHGKCKKNVKMPPPKKRRRHFNEVIIQFFPVEWGQQGDSAAIPPR